MIIQSKDYLPPKSNSIYIYKGINNDTFTFKRYIEYINNDKIQIKFDNGINSFVNVYEYTPDGIKLATTQANHYIVKTLQLIQVV